MSFKLANKTSRAVQAKRSLETISEDIKALEVDPNFQPSPRSPASYLQQACLVLHWLSQRQKTEGVLLHLRITQKGHRQSIVSKTKDGSAIRPKPFVQHLPLPSWQWRRIPESP
ncbi:uncharacterized protein LOC122964318 [Acropora millepora]|uniref:uncharacterized protein LOC122964318 n=1 Tax=Acropora millepora TaxID=45264 RepID=UPI001CF4B12D|nr:uncharacterized protein LOC122964318 [Acropora millepora]